MKILSYMKTVRSAKKGWGPLVWIEHAHYRLKLCVKMLWMQKQRIDPNCIPSDESAAFVSVNRVRYISFEESLAKSEVVEVDS